MLLHDVKTEPFEPFNGAIAQLGERATEVTLRLYKSQGHRFNPGSSHFFFFSSFLNFFFPFAISFLLLSVLLRPVKGGADSEDESGRLERSINCRMKRVQHKSIAGPLDHDPAGGLIVSQ